MTDFRNFDQVKTNELFIKRYKWFFPYYELTDDQFVYGKLSYKGSFRRHAIIETQQGTFTIKHKGWFKRSFIISRGEDEIIGTLLPATWKRDVNLTMDNGFEAMFTYKKLFSMAFTLTHQTYGDILQIRQLPFGIKKPFSITYDQSVHINDMAPVPLLILAGVNLLLIRQKQAAAAH